MTTKRAASVEAFTDCAATEFALMYEYHTPVAVAVAVADLISLPELAGHDGVEPSVGIGQLVRALGRRTRHHDH